MAERRLSLANLKATTADDDKMVGMDTRHFCPNYERVDTHLYEHVICK